MQADRDYLSVKLDDPSFPAPIYASRNEVTDGVSLIWRGRCARGCGGARGQCRQSVWIAHQDGGRLLAGDPENRARQACPGRIRC
ncbi:DUF736 family protein [Brevundimonas sp.]|uniref:DUF736 family protein n=1 Tax=Brevundimonas sp. TaxID=1871086 RepID=UPI003D124255